ncbi:MAG TPA: recombination protein RecR [Clostridia bacterium]|jgi:recombination protein RecR|nr:recombination protein RecR [Clostridia bacterium]
MIYHAKPVANLIAALNKLPGVGPKTAQRLAFHLLAVSREEAVNLAEAIVEAKDKVRHCSVCGDLTEEDPCFLCRNESRDRSILCVVESPKDVIALEKTREFKGLYHVLGGVISPMDGIGPEDLRIRELLHRLKQGDVKEVVIATNPNVEGEATSMYLAKLLEPLGVKTTRIAHGLPVGSELEYADEITLTRAFLGRREI